MDWQFDEDFIGQFYYEESCQAFFVENQNLDADFAQELVNKLNTYGVEIIFRNLDCFKAEAHSEIAQIFATYIKPEVIDKDSLGYVFMLKDSGFKTDNNSYLTFSAFMIAHNQFTALVDGNYSLKDPTNEQVLALVALSRFEKASFYLDRLTPEQMTTVIKRFNETGNNSLLFSFIEDPRNNEFAQSLKPDDLFAIFANQENQIYDWHRVFMAPFIVSHIGEITKYSTDEVVLSILKHTNGDPIFRATEIINFEDPDRIVEAIVQHVNVGELIKEIKSEYREPKLNIDIPPYVELAYKLAPRDLSRSILKVIKDATDNGVLNGQNVEDLSPIEIKIILGDKNLEKIGEIIVAQMMFKSERIDERFENLNLEIPPRVLRIRNEIPTLSDNSVSTVTSLYTYDDGVVAYRLKALGVTSTGEEGYSQLKENIAILDKQLEQKAPITFSIGDTLDGRVIRDIIKGKLKTILEQYDNSIFKVGFGEESTREQVDNNKKLYFETLEKIDSLFSSTSQRLVLDGKNVGRFVYEYSSMLDKSHFSRGESLFIPSICADIADRYSQVKGDVLKDIINLKFGIEVDTNIFLAMGAISDETFTYDDLVVSTDRLFSQLDIKEPFSFNINDEVVSAIVDQELAKRFAIVFEKQSAMANFEPGTDEHREAKNQYLKSTEIVDRVFSAIALGQIQKGEPVLPFLENYRDELTQYGMVLKVNTFVPSVLNPIGEHFGSYDPALIEQVISLRYGTQVPEMFKEFGIEKCGEAAYAQAQNIVAAIRAELLSGQVSQDNKNKALYSLVFADVVRIKTVTYGASDPAAIERMLSVDVEDSVYEPGVIRPLEKRQTTIVPNDQVAKAYNEIIIDFSRAEKIVDRDGNIDMVQLGVLFTEMETLSKIEIEKLKLQLEHIPSDKTARIEKINSQILELESITAEKLWEFPNLIKNIQTLSGFKEFKSPLRQFLMVGAIAQHPNIDRSAFVMLGNGKVLDETQAGIVSDFVSHIAYQESWKKMFESQSAMKSLNHVLQSEDLMSFVKAVADKAKSAGTRTQFTLVAVRGPLLDASGSIADTCWNGRPLTNEHENIAAVIIVKNSNLPMQARVAGAALLVQGMSQDGKPLLIIRGLNPLENDITGLMQDSFFLEFAKYAETIAKDQGRQLAVVIDAHSGGSATNRPTLYNYLAELRNDLEQVQLADDDSTTFNGYDIKGNTFLVGDLRELAVSCEAAAARRGPEHRSPTTVSRPGYSMAPTSSRPVPVPPVPVPASIHPII